MTRDHRGTLARVAAAVAGVSLALGPLAMMSAAAVSTTGSAAAAGSVPAAGSDEIFHCCDAEPGVVGLPRGDHAALQAQ